MNKVEDLRNLNDICQNKNSGIYKQWIYKDNCFMKMCDYMQKINYSIQDLNNMIKQISVFDYKNVVFVVVLVDWIKESVDKIIDSIDKRIMADFEYKDKDNLKKYKNYFRAIRSFIVAHPLSTTKHKDLGFDGNYICIDVRNYNGIINNHDIKFNMLLDTDGIKNSYVNNADFYLYCYSDKDDNMKYFRYVACYYKDIYDVAKIYIDELYELDKYLSKKKKKDYYSY